MTFMAKVYTLRTEVYSEGWNLWDETLYNRAFRVPKSVEELIFDAGPGADRAGAAKGD